MPLRTRTINEPATSGWLLKNGVYSTCSNAGGYSTCVDDTSKGDGLYFDVDSVEVSGGLYSGSRKRTDGTVYWQFANWRATAMEPFSQYQHVSMPTSKPGYSTVAAEVLKRTNPSRPRVDLPVSVGELRELPLLLRKQGVSILKEWKERFKSSSVKDKARLHLEFQFGWAPIANDLKKLLDFQESVNKRIKELKKLKERGLRRRVTVYSDSANATGSIKTLESNAFGLSGYAKAYTSCELSGFVVWRPAGSFPTDDSDIAALARRAVLGLYINPSAAWNLVPWTWLVDWFSNIGDWLESQSFLVPCTHSTVQVMDETHSEYNWVITSQSSYASTGEPFSLIREKKRRQPTSASLAASMPALTGGQASILASVGVLRR